MIIIQFSKKLSYESCSCISFTAEAENLTKTPVCSKILCGRKAIENFVRNKDILEIQNRICYMNLIKWEILVLLEAFII